MIRVVIVIFIIVFTTGCSKEDENKVRIYNELSKSVSNVRMNDVKYENLTSYSSSAYQVLEGGTYTLKAVIDGVSRVSDPVTIEDDGIRKWKVTIVSELKISVEEDPY